VISLALLAIQLLPARAAEEPSGLRPFLAKHCIECHGPDVSERKLRLDQLPADFAGKEPAAIWTKVLDKLTRGEMPPKDAPQPADKDRQAFGSFLRQELHAASLARQQKEGRVPIRRLNRTEYATTLRDLLGLPVELNNVLPDDNIAAGFDNVSAVLDVSATHLLRYQDAAERACQAVIPSRPPTKISERRTGRQVTEKMSVFKDILGKYVWLDGDALVMPARPYGHTPCATAPVPQYGTYRVRASVRTTNAGGKPLPVLLSCRDQYGRSDDDVRAVHDVPPDQPLVIEGQFEMRGRQVIVFTPWSLPDTRQFSAIFKGKSLEEYTGPALVVDWVEVSGPLDPWPTAGYQQLFAGVPLKARSVVKAEAEGRPAPNVENRDPGGWIYDPLVLAPTDPKADAERLLRRFLLRAFRRPVSNDLTAYYVKLAHAGLDRNEPFPDAMIGAYKAALCSPHFLFLTDGPREPGSSVKLDDYALASRLSYFLWSSLPDDELFAIAAKGELAKPAILHAQVERMLADPKSSRFTANFAGQWLELRNINATSPDPQLYGEFDPALFWAMPRETELCFEEILRHDRDLTEFVSSDWTFLNERLAQHYGISGVLGGEMRKVTLPPGSHRGGVLTQASVLKITADGTKTSPILRGKWVLERIIGLPPEPPPPDIPAIEPDIRGATTIRQQLDKHKSTAACAACHRHIDPPGFALESFDVIGGWRDFYRGSRSGQRVPLANYPGRTIAKGLDVELGGETPDGRKFQTIDDYKELLLADKDQLARNLAQKLIVYATGAEIQFADREVVEELVAECRARNYGFRSLVHAVVQSRVFLNK
jgi:mono/diheme cytochrome c family protein